jgi:enoyl-CoA hydratase
MKFRYTKENAIGKIAFAEIPLSGFPKTEFMDVRQLADFLRSPGIKAATIEGFGRCSNRGCDRLIGVIQRATVPIMALIEGSCGGVGLEIAMACHFRYCADDAVIQFPEPMNKHQLGFIGSGSLASVLGRGKAIELMVSGRSLDAVEASELGLVDRVFRGDELEAHATGYLKGLVEERTEMQVRSIVASIHNAQSMERTEALRHEIRMFLDLVENSMGATV